MAVGDQRSEFCNQGKVLLHVCCKHHIHHNASEVPLIAVRELSNEIAVQLLVVQQPASS